MLHNKSFYLLSVLFISSLYARRDIPLFFVKIYNHTNCPIVLLNTLQPTENDVLKPKLLSIRKEKSLLLPSQSLFIEESLMQQQSTYALYWHCSGAFSHIQATKNQFNKILFHKDTHNKVTVQQGDMLFLYNIGSTIEISLQPNGQYGIINYKFKR